MAAETDLLLRERPTPGVLLLTLNRPRVLNALSGALLGELIDTFDRMSDDDDTGAIVVTGAGRGFCSGGDLGELRAADDDAQRAYFALYQELFTAIRSLRAPVIAALNGPVFAGGLELACMCDLRLASTEAVLCVSDVPHGLGPTGGLTWTLPRLVGLGRAKWMALSDARVTAGQALTFGLVEEVLPGDLLLPRSIALAERIAAYPGIGVEITRSALDRAMETRLEDAMDHEIELDVRAMKHPAVGAAIDAFFRAD